MKRTFVLILGLWITLGSLSLSWNYFHMQQQQEEVLLLTSRAVFNHILHTRAWNAQHGGVYVPVTETNPPNPYMDPDGRDLKISDELTLTKIIPSYMTRQIAEIASARENFTSHITSLNPLRPGNEANEHEKRALTGFQDGRSEAHHFIDSPEGESFFYMAPLTAEKSCMQCHTKQGSAEQGDKQGGTLGGISITLSDAHRADIGPILFSHLAIGLAGIFLIVSLRNKLQQAYHRLHKQTIIDPLTGIANRRYLTERLQIEIRRCQRHESILSLLICDIDHFKAYNDHYGHLAGDHCLTKVAAAINHSITRASDLAARFGGEEFVCVLADTDEQGIRELAERIRRNVEELAIPHEMSPTSAFVTISVGYTTQTHCGDGEDMLKRADQALYRAKAQGRNQISGPAEQASK